MEDPYVLRNNIIYTWLLCWKNNPLIRKNLNKDIALKIAKLIQVDMSDWCYWNGKQMHFAVWFRGPYEWIWLVKEETYAKAPCNICWRPCERIIGIIENYENCKVHGRQVEGMIRKNCKDCGKFGICLPCSHVLLVSKKYIIPEEKYTINHPKLKDFTKKDHICFNCGIHFKMNEQDDDWFIPACSDKCDDLLHNEKYNKIIEYRTNFGLNWKEHYLEDEFRR